MRLTHTTIRAALAGAGLCLGVASAQAGYLLNEDFDDITLNAVGVSGNPLTSTSVVTVQSILNSLAGQLPTGTSQTGNGGVNIRNSANVINAGAAAASSFSSFFPASASNNFLVLGDTVGNLGGSPSGSAAGQVSSATFSLGNFAFGSHSLGISFDYVFDTSKNTTGLTDTFFVELIGTSPITQLLAFSTVQQNDINSKEHFNQTMNFNIDSAVPVEVSLEFRLTEYSISGEATPVNSSAVGIDNISVVPEPTSIALLGIGLLGLAGARKQRTPAA